MKALSILTNDSNVAAAITCSGGTAALDMMLYLIKTQHGHALATAGSAAVHPRPVGDHDVHPEREGHLEDHASAGTPS